MFEEIQIVIILQIYTVIRAFLAGKMFQSSVASQLKIYIAFAKVIYCQQLPACCTINEQDKVINAEAGYHNLYDR
jgi:hypothetical protein